MTKIFLKTAIIFIIAPLLGCQPPTADNTIQPDKPPLHQDTASKNPVDATNDSIEQVPLSTDTESASAEPPSIDTEPTTESPETANDADSGTKPQPTPAPEIESTADTEVTTPQTDQPDSNNDRELPGPVPPARQPETDSSQPPSTDNSSTKDRPAEEVPEVFTLCDQIFKTYVDKNGNVDYATLRRKRSQLYHVARVFENIDPADYLPWSKQQKTAFWINAFNIFTMQVVVDNYPIQGKWYKVNYPKDSIIQIESPWTKLYFNVMGIQYTLREIEREMLLSKFRDMRTCFALSYATLGGAFMRNEAYLPAKLDVQLDKQASRYLKDPRGMRIVTAEKTVYLGDIFNWYRKEFVAQFSDQKKYRQHPQPLQSYLVFISQHVSEKQAKYLQSEDMVFKFQKYDWHLNEQPDSK